jgi:hypothetical protein
LPLMTGLLTLVANSSSTHMKIFGR